MRAQKPDAGRQGAAREGPLHGTGSWGGAKLRQSRLLYEEE